MPQQNNWVGEEKGESDLRALAAELIDFDVRLLISAAWNADRGLTSVLI
jgi:hypothetical protein